MDRGRGRHMAPVVASEPGRASANVGAAGLAGWLRRGLHNRLRARARTARPSGSLPCSCRTSRLGVCSATPAPGGGVPNPSVRRRYTMQAVRSPSGNVYRLDGKRRPVWYARYRLPDGREVRKRIGPAWTDRGRPAAGYHTKRTAEIWLSDVLAQARRGTMPLSASAPDPRQRSGGGRRFRTPARSSTRICCRRSGSGASRTSQPWRSRPFKPSSHAGSGGAT